MRKILTGVALGLFGILLALAPAGSTGTSVQRARAMRTAFDEPASTPTTAPPVPTEIKPTTDPPAAVAVAPPAPAPPAPAPAPPVTPPVVTTPAVKAAPGHYSCPGDQAHQFSDPCVNDFANDPGPNAGSDDPKKTVAGGDPGYAGQMISDLCEARPVLCEDPSTPVL